MTHELITHRHGRRVSHYEYRGIRIDRWVRERGNFTGNTTIYNPAGTEYEYKVIYLDGSTDTFRWTQQSLKSLLAHIDRRLDKGDQFFGPGYRVVVEWAVSTNGNMIQVSREELAK